MLSCIEDGDEAWRWAPAQGVRPTRQSAHGKENAAQTLRAYFTHKPEMHSRSFRGRLVGGGEGVVLAMFLAEGGGVSRRWYKAE